MAPAEAIHPTQRVATLLDYHGELAGLLLNSSLLSALIR